MNFHYRGIGRVTVFTIALSGVWTGGALATTNTCEGAGDLVVVDAAGDGAQGNPELDILELHIAEQAAGALAGRLLVRLRVDHLSRPAPAPAAFWIVGWKGPSHNGQTTLTMSTCGNSRPSFTYSFSDSDGISASGAPDSAWFTQDGEIVFALDRAQIGDPHTGDRIHDINALAIQFAHADSICAPGVIVGNDGAGTGAYTFGTCVLAAAPERAVPLVRLGPAFPNPAGSAVRLALEVPADLAGRDCEVAAYDVTGRCTRHLGRHASIAGSSWIAWDLRDDAGRRVRPGVYWVGVTLAGSRRANIVQVTH